MAPSAQNFHHIPAFPDDVTTAPLLRLSLTKLLARDETEVQRFCTACEDVGFFYLDLRGPGSGDAMLEEADRLFEVGERLYELDIEEKRKYDFSKQNSYFGYKEQGAAVVDGDGRRDRNEFYNVSKDDILGISDPLPAPDVLAESRELIKSFMINAHSVITLVLNLLNEHLKLPQDTLADMHRLSAASGDQVRFVKAPPQPMDDRRVALGAHTDFGSVTVLFNRLGGLQILPPGKDAEWCYVRPLPGHAIVNLGDAMVKFTNGLLRSNIHRVVSPPGAQADTTRHSLVYFSRPENDVLLKRLEGSSLIPSLPEGMKEDNVKSQDWVIRRALNNRVDLHDKIDYERYAGTEVQSQRLYA